MLSFVKTVRLPISKQFTDFTFRYISGFFNADLLKFWSSFDLDKVCFYSEKSKWIKAAGNIWVLKGKQEQRVLRYF